MKVLFYGENGKELRQLTEYLKYCGRTEPDQADVTLFSEHVDFCRAVRDGTGFPLTAGKDEV